MGVAITELAKLHMYCFFYDQVIPSWGRDRVELLMTDTDSLMLEIKTRDLWRDIDKLNFYNGDWIEEEGNERMERLESSNQKQEKTQSLSLWVSAPRCTHLSLRAMSKPTCKPKVWERKHWRPSSTATTSSALPMAHLTL